MCNLLELFSWRNDPNDYSPRPIFRNNISFPRVSYYPTDIWQILLNKFSRLTLYNSKDNCTWKHVQSKDNRGNPKWRYTEKILFSSSSSFRVIFQKDNRQGGILKEGVAWNEDTTALTWQCKHVHLFLPGGCEGGCGPIKSCLSFSPLPLRPSLNDVPG